MSEVNIAPAPEEVLGNLLEQVNDDGKVLLLKASSAMAYAVQDLYSMGEAMETPEDSADWISVYTDHVWAYAGIYAVANTIAQLGWCMYRQEPGGEPEEVDSHPVLDLLSYPNEDTTGYDQMEALVVYLETVGIAYWEIVDAQKEKQIAGQPVAFSEPYPGELWNIRPDWLTPVPAKDGKGIDHYEFQTRKHARKRPFPKDHIVPFRYFHPMGDLLGLGSLMPALDDLRQDKQMAAWNLDYFEHGTVPEGVFTTPEKTITRVDMDNLSNQLKQFVEGKGRTNLILSHGLEYKQAGTARKDVDYRDGRSDNRQSILAAIGVPPVKVGLLEHAKYDNYALQVESFHRDTIIPKTKRIEGSANLHLLPRFPDIAADRDQGVKVWVEINRDSISREDDDKLSKRVTLLVRTGLMTPNEGREVLGWDEYNEEQPGGDQFYMEKNLVPVTGESEEPKEETPGVMPEELDIELAEDELQKRVVRLESVAKGLQDDVDRLEAELADKDQEEKPTD